MLMPRILAVLAAVALLIAACGGDSISATNCEELADETIGMFQRLIDDVDNEFGEMTMEEFVASGDELPSVEEFEEDAATIDELATELGCSPDEMSAEVAQRLDTPAKRLARYRLNLGVLRAGGL